MQSAADIHAAEGPRSVNQKPAGWQRELARAVTDPAQLLQMLDLPASLLPGAQRAARLFRLRVPLGYVVRMCPGDAADPLLRQVLPLDAETRDTPGYSNDPVGDLASVRGTGLLHKYRGRALLITTGACAVHCRYCFRRHFPYASAHAGRARWTQVVAQIRADPSLHEIILSGGDPLSLSDARLAELVQQLEAIPHLQRLRIHSRQPVVLPERVDAALLEWMGRGRLRKVLVVHANHPRELNDATAEAFERVRGSGVFLLNQSVLLRGVNDDVGVLMQLSECLFRQGVLPYYLHLLDPVAGAAHFDVPVARARGLYRELAARLPGYLLPKLAREEAGQPGKTLLGTAP